MSKKSAVLRIVALALVFVLIMGVMSTAFAEAITGTTRSNVNLRTHPSKSASVIAMLSASTSVSVLSLVKKGTVVDGVTADDDWYNVSTSVGTGYVSAAYITVSSATTSATPAPSAAPSVVQYSNGSLADFNGEVYEVNGQRYQKVYITASNVSLRQSASNTSSRLATLPKNAGAGLLGISPDFYKIIYNTKIGYVAKQYVRLTGTVVANTAAPAVAAAPSAGWTPVADAPQARLTESEAKFWATVPSLYNEYKSSNGDTVGYLALPNTNVRYPVMFTGSDYYLTHGIYKNSDKAGLPYIHKNYKDPNQRRHIVVAGHNLSKSGRMFNKLNNYKSLNFYLSNPIIRFDLYGVPGEWQIFSDHISKPDSKYIRMSFSSDDDWLNYLNWLETESDHYGKAPDVALRSNDSVLTLYTCTYESWLGVKGRYFVHFRRVR